MKANLLDKLIRFLYVLLLIIICITIWITIKP